MHALETSKLLTEEYSAKILPATMSRPRSALELSEKLGIPIAACYRKIKLLENGGLIYCHERRLTRAGKRVSVFRSRVRNAQIIFEKGNIRARLEMVDGTTEDYNYNLNASILLAQDVPLART